MTAEFFNNFDHILVTKPLDDYGKTHSQLKIIKKSNKSSEKECWLSRLMLHCPMMEFLLFFLLQRGAGM